MKIIAALFVLFLIWICAYVVIANEKYDSFHKPEEKASGSELQVTYIYSRGSMIPVYYFK